MSHPFLNIAIQPLDDDHIADTLSCVPQAYHIDLLADYQRKYKDSRQDANLNLLQVKKFAKTKRFLRHEDEDIRKKADRLSKHAHRIIHHSGLDAGLVLLADNGIDTPKHETEEGLKSRLLDECWWRGQLMAKHDRDFEEAGIHFGLVRKWKQPYITSYSLEKVLSRYARSLDMMTKMEAINEDGESVDMLDIIKGSTANPAVKRAELMNRLQGFEQYAIAKGHIAEFYTITVPSKYHPSSSKYNGWTPRKVQQEYLSPLWARIRAKLKRDGLSVYGFRIAEPHADACPHWHILLYMPEAQKIKVRNILKSYALHEDGTELGANKHRFTVEAIDPKKGSATGYIAKYIAKNIDGFCMEGENDDETGKPINETAQRVRAWASIWGIRQFQQIGGSSITVWRELRRLEGEQTNELIEKARKAADSGDWKAYLEAQGGTNTPFKDQPIRTARDIPVDDETGEVKLNKYGELVEHVKGVMVTGLVIETRLKNWTIQYKADDENPSPTLPAESVERGIQRLLQDAYEAPAQELNFSTEPEFRTSWSSVVNCTERIKNPKSDEKIRRNY